MTESVATIAVVLPVYNRKDITLKCLKSLHNFVSNEYSLFYVVIDDGSTDGTGTAIKDIFADVIVLNGDGNLWWAGGVNKGLDYVKSHVACDFILLMNDDSDFSQKTLDILYDYVSKRRNICASAIAIIGETSAIYCAGHAMNGRFSNCLPLYQGSNMDNSVPTVIKCDSLSSRFVLMPFEILNKVGLFDNKKFPHAYSDIEYFLRAKAKGYSNVVLSESIVSTNLNTSYIQYSYFSMNRMQYVKSLFSHKYGNNLKMLIMSSIMHRSIINSIFLLIKNILSVIKMLIIKIFLPKTFVKKLISR